MNAIRDSKNGTSKKLIVQLIIKAFYLVERYIDWNLKFSAARKRFNGSFR